MNKYLSTTLELVGAGLVIWALALIAVPLAIAAAGFAAIIVGFGIGAEK